MMHNQSILPSPARLGLPVSHSHSPAMPAPGPLPPPSSAQKISQRTTPLSNLPPQRRAQMLLQEMAGLTSRIFEVSSNKAAWLTAYRGSTPTFLAGSSIPPEAAAATTTKEILSMLSSHQTLLDEAMAELQELQDIEEEKQRIAVEVASKDSAMRAFAKGLRSSEQVLEQTLEEYEGYTKGKRRRKTAGGGGGGNPSFDGVGLGDLELSDLLTYAHRISYTTFAPPEFGAGQGPLRGALPPAPQEEQMRASQLYQFADLDVGIPKPVVTEAIPVAIVEPVVESAMEISTQGVPGLPPLPPVPAGWRPGMPVEIPSNLPPVPPGWKPGDPISLPPGMEIPAGWKPGDAVVLPPKAEEPMQVQPKTLAPATANAEPIQVRYVQLDINPDMQDEYSSDYSSEEGSSEEEDED